MALKSLETQAQTCMNTELLIIFKSRVQARVNMTGRKRFKVDK